MHGSTPPAETCPYCDGPMDFQNKDHIVPRSMRVNLGALNLIRVCRPCNDTKGAMTVNALRALAQDIFAHAERVDRIADRVEAIMAERGLQY